MLNLYAYRATKPTYMWKAWKSGVDIIGGAENWTESVHIYAMEHKCERVIAAWGTHGGQRGTSVLLNWPAWNASPSTPMAHRSTRST